MRIQAINGIWSSVRFVSERSGAVSGGYGDAFTRGAGPTGPDSPEFGHHRISLFGAGLPVSQGISEDPMPDDPVEGPERPPLPGEETEEPDPLEGLVDVEPGIKAKIEVNIANLVPELRSKFGVVFAAYQKFGYADYESNPMVLTSGNDSLAEHKRNSYHKYDRAIDVRGKHVPDSILRKIAAEIQKNLGEEFLVIAEIARTSKYWYKDHIHIEYHGETGGTQGAP